MNRRDFLGGAGALAALAAAGGARAESEQEALVEKTIASLSHFLRDPDMTWFQSNVSRSRAILIAPEIVKAGFIIGGSGGRAVLVARDRSGKWAGPVFYSLATASIGFQAGLQVAEAATLVMTEKAFNSLLGTSMKFGGDASIAAGPVGAGAKQEVVTDLVSFSRAKGLYGGLNLDGTVVSVSDEWNSAFYGKRASADEVLVKRSVSSPRASRLLRAVAGGASAR